MEDGIRIPVFMLFGFINHTLSLGINYKSILALEVT
jgi:hypothetical protein